MEEESGNPLTKTAEDSNPTNSTGDIISYQNIILDQNITSEYLENAIKINDITVQGNTATLDVNIGEDRFNFTIPRKILYKLYRLFYMGINWAILVTSIALAYWPNKLEKKACLRYSGKNGIDFITIMQRDTAKQIFIFTLITRMGVGALPLIYRLIKKITASFQQYPDEDQQEYFLRKLSNTLEALEDTCLSAATAFAYLGLNPLLRRSSLANYSYILASIVAVPPIVNFIYSCINPFHLRGSWQDYRERYSLITALVFTLTEGLFNSVISASLATLIADVIYDTMVNAARNVDVPPEERDNVYFYLTIGFASAGIISIINRKLWKMINALSNGASIFYGVYNILVAYMVCFYPQEFLPAIFVERGWALEALPVALAFSLALITIADTYTQMTDWPKMGLRRKVSKIYDTIQVENRLLISWEASEEEKEENPAQHALSDELSPPSSRSFLSLRSQESSLLASENSNYFKFTNFFFKSKSNKKANSLSLHSVIAEPPEIVQPEDKNCFDNMKEFFQHSLSFFKLSAADKNSDNRLSSYPIEEETSITEVSSISSGELSANTPTYDIYTTNTKLL